MTPKAYTDAGGNRYAVERASNGMWVCVRTNAGGHRKGHKTVGVAKSRERMQKVLDAYAEGNGWKETAD